MSEPMTVQRTKTYAVCPACGADAGCVDHLLGQALTTRWYCDACGQRYELAFSLGGGVVISRVEGRKVRTVDLLVLQPQAKPVYFIVEGLRFEEDGSERDEDEEKRFYYDEHSCPTNWLHPEMVYFNGDSDPHGLIEFVATRDDTGFPSKELHGPNARDAAMEAFIETRVTAAQRETREPLSVTRAPLGADRS